MGGKARITGVYTMEKSAPAELDGKRGYILSLMVLMLMSVLAIFANDVAVQKQQAHTLLQKQFYIEKTAFVIDDMAQDMRNILSIDAPSNSTQIVFNEDLTINKSLFLTDYSSFIGDFSKNVNVNLSFSYSDPFGISLSNGLTYTSNFTNQQIDLYDSNGGSVPATTYYISINSSRVSSTYSLPTFVASGTFVFLNFTDLAKPGKSFTASGYVNPNVSNQFDIKYPGNNHVYVNVGLVDGRQNSYQMQQDGVMALTRHSLTVNLTTRDGIHAVYSLPLNITMPGVSFIDRLPVR